MVQTAMFNEHLYFQMCELMEHVASYPGSSPAEIWGEKSLGMRLSAGWKWSQHITNKWFHFPVSLPQSILTSMQGELFYMECMYTVANSHVCISLLTTGCLFRELTKSYYLIGKLILSCPIWILPPFPVHVCDIAVFFIWSSIGEVPSTSQDRLVQKRPEQGMEFTVNLLTSASYVYSSLIS